MRLAGLALALALAAAACSTPEGPASSPQPTTRTASPSDGSSATAGHPRVVGTIATGLAVPWGVTFLPDGTALVGERDTTRIFAVAPGSRPQPVGRLDQAVPGGEAGLLGLAASPTYAEDHLVFAYFTSDTDNRVVRMRYDGHRLGPPEPILTGIPRGAIHDGGRLLFDPAGNLFVSTGETGDMSLAQDPDSLGGKILHITTEGGPAPDNPDPESPVWTTGHRNVQGLAFDDRGRLWATEFGLDTWDELNLIAPGKNYGWPLCEGRCSDNRFRNPFVQWHPDQSSPSGLAYLDGMLWAASLRGERLWRIPVTSEGVGQPEDFFVGHFGRLRTVTVTPDGNLWVTTSNRDGRADPPFPRAGDDRILLVRP